MKKGAAIGEISEHEFDQNLKGGQKNQHMSTMMTLSGYTLLVERNPSLFNFAG